MTSTPCHVLLISDRGSRLFSTVEPLLMTPGQRPAAATDLPLLPGCHCESVEGVEEGVRAMCRNEHDVYLVDQIQEGNPAGGFDLLRIAAAKGCLQPAILLTDDPSEAALRDALAAGAADFLPKSEMNAFTLRRAVRWAVEKASVSRSLRESERLLRDFLEHVPGAVFIKDLEGRYVYINKTGRHAFRQRVGEDDWLGRTDAEIWPSVAAALRRTDRQVIESGESVEATDVLDDGTGRLTHWLVHKFPVRDSGGGVRALGGVSLDITERVRHAAGERNRAQMLAAIATNVPIIAGRINADGVIIEAVGTLSPGRDDAAYLLRRNVFQAWPDHAPLVRRALAGETVQFPWTGVVGQRVMHLESHLFFDAENGSGIIFFSRDVTERRLLQNQVLDISDTEQRRLGQDLHDGLGQHLAGLTYLADALAGSLEARDVPEAADARGIVTLLGEAMAQTRELARGLSPVDFSNGGLVRSLGRLAARVEKMFSVRCELVVAPEAESCFAEARDSRAVTHLYRIAQEASTNAVRHGRARLVRLELSADPVAGRASLTITDDGVGFLPGAPAEAGAERNGTPAPAVTPTPSGGGLGLHMMDHRAASLSGRLKVENNPGGGTRISCTFPLSRLSCAATRAERP